MISNDATRVALRPTRSPKCPNRAAPNGRAMNAIAKVANALSCCTPGAPGGKKTGPITRAVAVA